jgi:FkbM family methyltransferase
MLKGLAFVASRAFEQTLIEPRRARAFDRLSESYLHTTGDGLKFHLVPGEHIDRFIAVEGIYERRFLNYIKTLLPKGAVILDIGANIGNHAIFLSRHCSQVHCFEPNPRVAARLRKNVSANEAHHIKVHQFGLGDRDETHTFHENIAGNLGASHFANGEALPEGHRAVDLEIRQAEKAINALNLKRIDFIKIDVEGMEEQVLKSIAPIIERYRPVVAFEHHETRVSAGTFAKIRACFPADYRIVEAQFAPDGSARTKALWNLKHDAGPVLSEVIEPERRSYEALIAAPV